MSISDSPHDRLRSASSGASIVLAICAALVSSCKSPDPTPDLSGIYGRAAGFHERHRNPVILIPGILGSKLFDEASQRQAWGVFTSEAVLPNSPEDARTIALPMAEGVPLSDLTDTIREDGALDQIEVSVLGLPVSVDAYRQILGTLGIGGYRDELLGMSGAVDYGEDHFTCFQYSYDWRRDISENAAMLSAFIEEKAAYVRKERIARYGDESKVEFDIVAHSMGGLLARYYARFGAQVLPNDGTVPPVTWSGAERIGRLITIGTPNGGSLNSVKELVGGLKLGPFIPRYPPAIVGTLPAVYELLPRPRHGALVDAATGEPLDLLDPDLWVASGWGLAAPDQAEMLRWLLPEAADDSERRRIALDHQAKCLHRTRQLQAALDQVAERPSGFELFLLVGDAIPTTAVYALDRDNGTWTVSEYAPGDGTVLRTSALLDERVGGEWQPYLVSPIDWNHVMFLFRDHVGLTKDPIFTDNVLYLLLEDPR